MKRRSLIVIMLAFIMIVSAFPAFSFAAGSEIDSGTCGTCSWSIDSNGVLTIGAGSMGDWGNIPPWYDYAESITEVKTTGPVKLATGKSMFQWCRRLSDIDLSNYDTSNVTSMCCMFENCKSLTGPDLSSFDTGNVTDMSFMFRDCGSLSSLDLSKFYTGNVTDMSGMFEYCSSLKALDLSKFDTHNVVSMTYMFRGLSLTGLDLSKFDTGNVESMTCMFESCSSLKTLDLSSFDTANVTEMRYMFKSCSSLTDLDISSFDTGNVRYMWEMFRDCSSLLSLDLSSFDLSSCTDMNEIFTGCDALRTLKVGKWIYDKEYLDPPVFPKSMTDTETGTVYNKGDAIPELSYRTYESAGGIDISTADVALSQSHFVYNGKAHTPPVTVTSSGKTLTEGTDYTVSYHNNVNAGTAYVDVAGQSPNSGTVRMSYTIAKASNPFAVSTKTASVKYKKLKKKAQSLAVSKVLTIARAQGAVTYTKVSGNKKITINKSTGKVTVKKGLKKGTYKVKVKVQASGTANYAASPARTVTFKIKVK